MKRNKQKSVSVRRYDPSTRRRLLGLESLESRRLLATITWTGAAGTFDWGTAGNWSSDTNTAAVPTAVNDVIIPSLAGSQTITIASGTRAARTIQVGGDEKLRITGGTLTVSGASTVLSGTGNLEVAGGALTLTGSNWANTSTLVLSSGTLNLGGSLTQTSLGAFNRSGGTVNLNGNVEGNLALGGSTGSWNFGGSGQLRNGTITVDPSVEFQSSGFYTFDNVTIAAGSAVKVASGSARLTIVNGLTVDGRLLLGDTANFGQLLSNPLSGNGSQTIGGTGRIEFNHLGNVINSSFNSFTGATGGMLVIGSGITLAGQDPAATNERIRFEGNGTFELQGMLEVDGATASIDIEPTGASSLFTNTGTIRSTLGTLNIRPTSFINGTDGEVITSGGSFLIGGDATQNRTWTNQGLIQVTDTTVSLGGNFTQYAMGIKSPVSGQGTFNRTGGTVTLVGNLTGPLALNPDTGTWRYGGSGTLRDSTLTVDSSVDFQSSGFYTFDNVTIAAGSAVKVASGTARLTIVNGLTVDGRLLLGDTANFGLLLSNRTSGNGSQLIGGTGRIEFNHQGNVINSSFANPATGGTLVIGSGITLAGQDPAATNERIWFNGNGSILFQGTLEVSGPAARADITATRFENQGTLRAANAAVIDVRSTTFVNFTDVTNLGNNRFGVTLRDGAYEVDGGTIRLFQGTNAAHSFVVKKLEAELILAGTMPRVFGHTTNTTSAIAELSEIGAAGHLQLRNGVFYGPAGEVIVRGEVDVDATSQFGLAPLAPITTAGLQSHFAANGNYGNNVAEAIIAERRPQPIDGKEFDPGVEGQGFFFDAVNDHVTIPAVAALNNPDLTVSAWYKLDQLLQGPRVLFGKTIGNGTLNSYAVWLNGDSINYGIGNQFGFDWQSVALVRQVSRLNHVALTFETFDDDANLVQLYHNGSLLHSFTTTRSIFYDDDRPHVLGADIETGNPAYFFRGVIDEVRHYDRALSASEIFDIAADTPLVATTIRHVDGEVRVGGSLASYDQYLLEGGTLFGVGTLPTNLNQLGGTLAPGNSPGCMEIDGDYNLAAAGTLQIEIDGPTVCTQYDRLQVNGNVTVAGTLDVVLDPTYSPVVGEKFLVLENDQSDAIDGEFLFADNPLRERQVFIVNGDQLFRISYIGGDGNDVELEFLGKGALVSNTDDSGPGSLRQAVDDANASPGHDLIAFAIDDALQVNGRYLIESTGLDVTDATTINATTQYDFSGVPVVELRDQLGNSAIGLAFSLGFVRGSEVRGLSMTGWATGILINYEDVLIAGNYFGIALDGSTGGGNGVGIEVAYVNDPAVRIGGTASSERNVIANSTFAGIYILANGVIIEGNYIGTDPTGFLPRPNQRGIYIERTFLQPTDDNTIGGSVTGAGNLISGNTLAGIEIDANGFFVSGNIVEGNWIGLDASGNAALPNGDGVVLVDSGAANVFANVISGNSGSGVVIDGASDNRIARNTIGLNVAGNAKVPNVFAGVEIRNGSSSNTIGGVNDEDTTYRNIISGNGVYGVYILQTSGNAVLGNYLGLDALGEIALANGSVAIQLDNASFTTIGKEHPDGAYSPNRIVGSNGGTTGIDISQSTNTYVQSNYFGLSATNQPLGYFGNAISLSDSDNNFIGAAGPGANVIGQYSSQGIVVGNGSDGNAIAGNYVGVTPDGLSPLFTESHSNYGIAILNSSSNEVRENLIGGNFTGVFVTGTQAGTPSSDNSIVGNRIGLTANGLGTIGNAFGVVVGGATNTLIGGVGPGEANTISGNGIGVSVYASSIDTLISGNRVGLDGTPSGTAVGNQFHGIELIDSIGSIANDNEVVGSGDTGIRVVGTNAVLRRNLVYGSLASITTDTAPGSIVITQARVDGFVLGRVEGATPLTTFEVEFFAADESGQAQEFVGSSAIVTDENGQAEFEASGLGDLPPARFLTATIRGARTEGSSDISTSELAAGVKPQLALIRGLPSRSPEGTPISLKAFAIQGTVAGFAVTGYVWQIDKGVASYATGEEAGIQFAPDDEGTYTVRLTLVLTNALGERRFEELGPHTINVFNVAPVPQFKISVDSLGAGQPSVVELVSNSSDAGQLDQLLYSWVVRQGRPDGPLVFQQTPSADAATVSFEVTAGGNYFATLTVNDQDGGLALLTRQFTANGLPQAVEIIAPSTGSEGQTVRARAPEEILQRAEEFNFQWHVIKNPVQVGPQESFSPPETSAGVIDFIPDDDGIYRVLLTLSLRDGSAALPEVEHDIEVTNASPVVAIEGGSLAAPLNQPIDLTAIITDPGTADDHQVQWTVLRNGAEFASGSSDFADTDKQFSFTPDRGGVYTVSATAVDDDFDAATGVGRGVGQRVFYVSQAAIPIAVISPAGPFTEGDNYVFESTIDLPAGVTADSYQWQAFNARGQVVASDSSTLTAGDIVPEFQFQPPQGEEYLIALEVIFSDGRTGRGLSELLTAVGRAPELDPLQIVSPIGAVREGDAVVVRASALDAGEPIGLRYTWEIKRPGAGEFSAIASRATRPSDLLFTPTNQGVHEVRVTVTDSQGLTATETLIENVANVAPTVRLSIASQVGASIVFEAIGDDVGAEDLPLLTYQWSLDGVNFTAASSSNQFPTTLGALGTVLAVRVNDDQTSTTVRSYLLQGSASDDVFTIGSTQAQAAVSAGASQLVYLALAGDDRITVDASVNTYPSLTIVVFGGDGRDQLNASAATVNVILDGGDGDDVLLGGDGDDILIAGPGNNVLFGGPVDINNVPIGGGNNLFIGGGNDTMTGGIGDDTYVVHFSEVVINDVEGGFNTVDLSRIAGAVDSNHVTQGVTLELLELDDETNGVPQIVFPTTSNNSTLALKGSFARLIGSPFNDTITAGVAGTEIRGGAGNDVLIARASGVTLSGGDGDDTLVLSGGSGTILGGAGNDTLIGTLGAGLSVLDLGDGDDTLEITGPSTGTLPTVQISAGDGQNSITASRIQGKIFAYTGGLVGTTTEFGAQRPSSFTSVVVNNSSDIGIFGSARGSTLSVSNSQDVSIFGGGNDSIALIDVTRATLEGSLFGSAAPNTLSLTVSNSSDIGIFGSTRVGQSLSVTVSNSEDIEIFGSRANNRLTVQNSEDVSIFGVTEGSVELGSELQVGATRAAIHISDFGSANPTNPLTLLVSNSEDIEIFGSSRPSPTSARINATVSNSSDIGIFGSAAGNDRLTVLNSQDISIFGMRDGEIQFGPTTGLGAGVAGAIITLDEFGSAAPNTGTLAITVNNSQDIGIFGSGSPNTARMNATVNNSADIGIFGSAAGGTLTVANSQDIAIYGQASEQVWLEGVIRGDIFTEVFGTARPSGPLSITVSGNSSDIGIFGSASRRASVTVSNSSDVQIFGGVASEEVLGETLYGDVVSLEGVTGAVVAAGIFGSTAPGGARVMSLTVAANSSDIEIFGSRRGTSTISINSSQDIAIFGGYGDEVTLQDAERIRVEGGVFGAALPNRRGVTATISGNSSDIGIFGSSVADEVHVLGGSRIGVDLRSGDDVVLIDGATQVVAINDGDDDFIKVLSGSNMLLYLGAGDDRAAIYGGSDIRVIGGTGNDQFMVGSQAGAPPENKPQLIDVDGGDGEDYLLILDGDSVWARLDGDADEAKVLGGVGVQVNSGAGNDSLTQYGSLGVGLSSALQPGTMLAILDGADGDDTLAVLPLLTAKTRAELGLAHPGSLEAADPLAGIPAWMTMSSMTMSSMTMILPAALVEPTQDTFSSSVAAVGGDGDDTIWLSGNARLFGLGGDGNDEIHLLRGSRSVLAGGDGDDRLILRSLGVDNYAFGDRGNDTIDVYGGVRLGVFSEEGDDRIEFHEGQQSFARSGMGEDTLIVYGGRDLIVSGEFGDNRLEVEGGVNILAAGGVGHDYLEVSGGDQVVLLGESGFDHLVYVSGSGVVLSGGDGNDVLEAFARDADLYGDDGDDTYRIYPVALDYAGDKFELRLRELQFSAGGNIEKEARGSDTLDLSAFTTGVVFDLNLVEQIQTLLSELEIELVGAFENIIGTSGDDWLIGNQFSNRLEGGPGDDILIGNEGDDILIGGGGDDVLDGGDGDDTYVFSTESGDSLGSDIIYETTGGGVDLLDFSGMPVGIDFLDLSSDYPQIIAAELLTLTLHSSGFNTDVEEIEEVIGTPFDDTVVGNSLDNRFELLGGDDWVDGGGGEDIYAFRGRDLGSIVIADLLEPGESGLATLDFAGFDAPLVLDLAVTTPQDLGGQLTLTLASDLSIANVVGTSFDDRIFGNGLDNWLYGAAGSDYLDGRDGNDTLVADLPAVVYLDFDSAYDAERGDYFYTLDEPEQPGEPQLLGERSLVQAIVERSYAGFNWIITQDRDEARELTRRMGRNFVTLAFNQGRGGGVAGDAGEIDFRNINRRLTSEVNINALMPTIEQMVLDNLELVFTAENIDPSQLTEEAYAAYYNAEKSRLVVAITGTIAAHELGHTAGLRHADALGPIGSGFYPDMDLSRMYPDYEGIFQALAARHHIMASPASLGTTIADAAESTYFGVRESVKLAFNEIGRSVREQDLQTDAGDSAGDFETHSTFDSAVDLGSLHPLYVPNLAPGEAYAYHGQQFDVSAIAVIGDLQYSTDVQRTEVDFYKFSGRAGEYVNIELIANSLRPARGAAFDGELRLFDADWNELAFNDDEWEGTKDAVLFDVRLPATGEYYLAVALSEEPAFESRAGRYELLIWRLRLPESADLPVSVDLPEPEDLPVSEDPTPHVVGDTLVGGLGENVLIGAAADDLFLGTHGGGSDTLFGRGGHDVLDVQGLDYLYGQLDSVEELINENIAPVATLQGIPTGPLEPNEAFTLSLVNPFDPSVADTTAGFRYAFAVLRQDGSIYLGSLPTTWEAASTDNQQQFTIPQAGDYNLVARVFDVRNGYQDYTAFIEVAGSQNQAPTDILLSSTTIAENLPAGSVVGVLSAVDPDAVDTHTFEFVVGEGDADNGLFEIVGRELRATLMFDYEARSNYSVRVQVRDSAGNTFAKTLAIAVGNAPELIGSIVVGDGTVQRSLVKKLSLMFDTQLQLDAGAFVVQRRDFNTANVLVPTNIPTQVVQVELPDGRWRVDITFVYAGLNQGVRNGSFALQDGNYQLLIQGDLIEAASSGIAFDADADGQAGGNRTFGAEAADRFYSFFGDIRGLRVVGAIENNALRRTLGKSSSHPDFDARFDSDGNNLIDAVDNTELRKSLLKRVFSWK